MTLLSACVSIIHKSNDALSDASGRRLLLLSKQNEARRMFKCPRSCLMTLTKGAYFYLTSGIVSGVTM